MHRRWLIVVASLMASSMGCLGLTIFRRCSGDSCRAAGTACLRGNRSTLVLEFAAIALFACMFVYTPATVHNAHPVNLSSHVGPLAALGGLLWLCLGAYAAPHGTGVVIKQRNRPARTVGLEPPPQRHSVVRQCMPLIGVRYDTVAIPKAG